MQVNLQFQNLQNQVAAAFVELFNMRLDDDVRQQASLEILLGKQFGVALRHKRAEVSRQNKPSGWESFDAENPDVFGLAERLPAPEPAEFESCRVANFGPAGEAMLAGLSVGTAALGKAAGLTQRRLQQILKEKIETVAAGQFDFFVEVAK